MKELIDRAALDDQTRAEMYELLKDYCRETGETAVIAAKHKGGWTDVLTITGGEMTIKSGAMSARPATDKAAMDVLKRASAEAVWDAVGGDIRDLRRFYELRDFFDDDVRFVKRVMDDLQTKAVGTTTELHFKDEEGKLHTLAFQKAQDDFLHPEENIVAILDGRKTSEAVAKTVLAKVEDIEKMAAIAHEKEVLMHMLKARAMAVAARIGVTAAQRALGEIRKGMTVTVGNR